MHYNVFHSAVGMLAFHRSSIWTALETLRLSRRCKWWSYWAVSTWLEVWTQSSRPSFTRLMVSSTVQLFHLHKACVFHFLCATHCHMSVVGWGCTARKTSDALQYKYGFLISWHRCGFCAAWPIHVMTTDSDYRGAATWSGKVFWLACHDYSTRPPQT